MILNGINFVGHTYLYPIIYIYRFIINRIRPNPYLIQDCVENEEEIDDLEANSTIIQN